MMEIKIGNRLIKDFTAPYIVAELASNHNGDMKLAKEMIKQAKEAGCDCVKFQSWTKDTIFSKKVYSDNYFLEDDYRNRKDFTLEGIVEKFSISEQQLLEMKNYCDELQIEFASTPFSKNEVNFLVDILKAKFIKVASMDLNNYPFLKYIAQKGLPVVLSTGLSSLAEVAEAVSTIENECNNQIVILHCISLYPPKDSEVNLNNIDMYRNTFNYPVGFSDHTMGTSIPLASVVKGACMVEKHFTLDKNMFGWDHKVSADFLDMKQIVNESRRINEALGKYQKTVLKDEIVKAEAFRRSIVAAKDIPEGKTIQEDDLDYKRPGIGIEPKYVSFIIGKKAKRNIEYDDILKMEDF
jgi:sialic acid synthase SpsE